jgi:dimethylhistidine N-methyltransferase
MHDELPPSPDADAETARFAADIRDGLSKAQKTIPCHYFYDQVGSELFEQITQLDEYYPTRTEAEILQSCVGEIAAGVVEGTVLVEFGSGSSVKTDSVLAACPAIQIYVPIDVSATMLEGAKARLEAKFPALTVSPVFGDFARPLALPSHLAGRPKLGFFPGSTIGNYGHEPAVELLAGFRALLGDGSRLIVGADLRKSPNILIPAYNDAAGVTAAFNLNLLVRINRELGGTFDLGGFRHDATYDVEAGRIDMWLVSTREQTVIAAGRAVHFSEGERIHTEISQKYSVEELHGIASRAGWMAGAVWTDPEQLFSVHELQSYA